MKSPRSSRRTCLQMLAAGAGVSAASLAGFGRNQEDKSLLSKPAAEALPDHERRMQWWRDAKFGMFIHWGLYSQLARGALFTRKNNTIYIHITSWPVKSITIGGIEKKPKGAKLVSLGKNLDMAQKGTQLIFSGLPETPPDDPVTVIAAGFDSAPIQDSLANRIVYGVLGGGPQG